MSKAKRPAGSCVSAAATPPSATAARRWRQTGIGSWHWLSRHCGGGIGGSTKVCSNFAINMKGTGHESRLQCHRCGRPYPRTVGSVGQIHGSEIPRRGAAPRQGRRRQGSARHRGADGRRQPAWLRRDRRPAGGRGGGGGRREGGKRGGGPG